MASFVYPSFEAAHDAGRVALAGGPLRVALLTAAYAPSPSHSRYADVKAAEASGLGYRAGGLPVTNAREEGGYLMADDVCWPLCSVKARGAVLYQDDGDRPLVAYLDFGWEEESVRGEFRVPGRLLELS